LYEEGSYENEIDLFFDRSGTIDKLYICSSPYHTDIHDPCANHNFNIHSYADIDKYTNSCTHRWIRPINDRDP